MRVHVGILGILLFVLALSFLAGVYFGSALFLLFLVFLFFPLACVVAAGVTHRTLRVHQEWDMAVPVRGDHIVYRLGITNTSTLPAPAVSVYLHDSLPDREIHVALSGRQTRTIQQRIHFPHRGIYDFGVKRIVSSDLLSLTSFRREPQTGRFFVYPRLYRLEGFSTVAEEILQTFGSRSGSGADDPSLFSQLREYRDGESIRHIFWRKYASTGKPFLREYEGKQNNGVVVYLDTRPASRTCNDPAEQEDVSVEITLAISRYLLEHRVPIRVSAPGLRSLEVETPLVSVFPRLYQEAAAFHFSHSPSPLTQFRTDLMAGMADRKVVIIVSHAPDQELVEFLRQRGEAATKIIVNLAGYSEREAGRLASLVPIASSSAVELFVLHKAEEIPTVLGREQYAGRYHAELEAT